MGGFWNTMQGDLGGWLVGVGLIAVIAIVMQLFDLLMMGVFGILLFLSVGFVVAAYMAGITPAQLADRPFPETFQIVYENTSRVIQAEIARRQASPQAASGESRVATSVARPAVNNPLTASVRSVSAPVGQKDWDSIIRQALVDYWNREKAAAIGETNRQLNDLRRRGVDQQECRADWCYTNRVYGQDPRQCAEYNIRMCEQNNRDTFSFRKRQYDKEVFDLTEALRQRQEAASGQDRLNNIRRCQAQVTRYEEKLVAYVNVREIGTPTYYQLKLELTYNGSRWMINSYVPNGPFEDTPAQRWCYQTVD